MIAAVDLGGTKIAVGLADAAGVLGRTESFPTRPGRGPGAIVAEIAERLRGLGAFDRVGVGSVGPLDLATGEILSPPNFPGWTRVPFKAMLQDALGVPVVVDNDANVAALGEYGQGAGRGAEVLVYATISTGIGGGIVIGGKLLHGLGGGAGEIGHQTVRPGGAPCGCGNRGCLEAEASGTAIARQAREAVARGEGAALLGLAGSIEALHAGHVAAAAQAGDPAAVDIWTGAMDALALGLSNVVSIVAPDRLVLGGGVTAVGEPLFEAVRAGLARHVKLVPVARLDLRPAALGARAGLVGAARLVV